MPLGREAGGELGAKPPAGGAGRAGRAPGGGAVPVTLMPHPASAPRLQRGAEGKKGGADGGGSAGQ